MLLAVRKIFHPIHYEQGTRFVPLFIYELFYVAKDCYFIPISHLVFDLSHPVLSGRPPVQVVFPRPLLSLESP